jgi:hypothetical protein
VVRLSLKAHAEDGDASHAADMWQPMQVAGPAARTTHRQSTEPERPAGVLLHNPWTSDHQEIQAGATVFVRAMASFGEGPAWWGTLEERNDCDFLACSGPLRGSEDMIMPSQCPHPTPSQTHAPTRTNARTPTRDAERRLQLSCCTSSRGMFGQSSCPGNMRLDIGPRGLGCARRPCHAFCLPTQSPSPAHRSHGTGCPLHGEGETATLWNDLVDLPWPFQS